MENSWSSRVTAFTVTRDGPLWLMVRQTRLGVTRWELPGGHVEAGETLEQAARRETLEETGVGVEVDRLLASCVHEWAEARERRFVCFFDARVGADVVPQVPPGEPDLVEAAWVDPVELADISPFLVPLVEQQASGWADAPIHFRMTQRRNAAGLWEPAPMRR